MSELDAKLKAASGPGDYYTFKIERWFTQLVLKFQDNSEFGQMNIHTSKALEKLLDRPPIHLDVIGSISTIREAIGRATKAADAVARVNINVYGSDVERKEVGRHLSDQKIYLQRPDYPRPGTIYDNPHFLTFPDMEMQRFDNQPVIEPNPVRTTGDREEFRQIVNGVYASLTRSTKLSRIEGDSRVTTKLRPYVLIFLQVDLCKP